MFLVRLALLPVLLALPACGTIQRGVEEPVRIEVTPPDALVRTSLDVACRGSCTVRAPRSQDFTVTASAPGYESATVEVRRRVSLAGATGVARNALGGPTVVGVGVDLYTRAAYDHVPNPVVIELERTRAQGPEMSKPLPPAS